MGHHSDTCDTCGDPCPAPMCNCEPCFAQHLRSKVRDRYYSEHGYYPQQPGERPIGSPGGRVHPAVPPYTPGYWDAGGVYHSAVGAGYGGGPGNGQGGSGFNGSNR